MSDIVDDNGDLLPGHTGRDNFGDGGFTFGRSDRILPGCFVRLPFHRGSSLLSGVGRSFCAGFFRPGKGLCFFTSRRNFFFCPLRFFLGELNNIDNGGNGHDD